MRLAALAATVTLAGCSAADDPDNVPLKGDWEVALDVTEVNFGGIDLSGLRLPPEFAALARRERFCAEPRFSSLEAMQDDLDRHLDGRCVIESYQADDRSISGSGRCEQVSDPALEYRPNLQFRGQLTETYYELAVTLEGDATVPQVGRRNLRMVARVQGQRAGDC